MSEVRVFEQNILAATARRSVRGDTFGTRRLAERIARRAKDIAERNASGGELMARTGDLSRSIVAFVEPDPRRPNQGFRVVLGSTLEYAEYLEKGTPGHFIFPVNWGYLKSRPNHPENRNPLEGRVYGGVYNPGVTARHWLRRSLNIAVRNSRVGTRTVA